MVIRSLGWDPGRHEEFRRSPKNKIHIRKVVSGGIGKVREFFGRVTEHSRRFKRSLEVGPIGLLGPHGP